MGSLTSFWVILGVAVVAGVGASVITEDGAVVLPGDILSQSSSAVEESPRLALSTKPIFIPLEGLVKGFNGTLGNGTIPIIFNPLPASSLVAKKGIVALLTLLKTVLPHAFLLILVASAVIVGLAFLYCTLTDCAAPFPAKTGNIFEPDYYRRNAYENDPHKFRPILQGIDEYKYKYSQIHPHPQKDF